MKKIIAWLVDVLQTVMDFLGQFNEKMEDVQNAVEDVEDAMGRALDEDDKEV